MLTYYDGEISVDKKYAKQLVEAFNTMTSLIETCEEEVLNSNTDGKAAIYFEYEEGGDNTTGLVNMANKLISEGIDVEMNIHYTNENGVGVLLIEDGQAVDLCGSECSIRDFSDEELLRELKRRGIDVWLIKDFYDLIESLVNKISHYKPDESGKYICEESIGGNYSGTNFEILIID